MTKDLLLAIDVGTQSVRALAFDRDGKMHGRAQVPFEPPFGSPQPGWAEKEAESYWQRLAEACRALWQQAGVAPERIAGLALTTQRGTVVCAREDGTPLRPAIVWPDQRLSTAPPPLGPLWTTLFGLAGAGELIRQLQRQAECNWLAQHEPDLWPACERYCLLSGWLTHRLVGEWVDSAACQVGHGRFGIFIECFLGFRIRLLGQLRILWLEEVLLPHVCLCQLGVRTSKLGVFFDCVLEGRNCRVITGSVLNI